MEEKINFRNGFLPTADPLKSLAKPYHEWEELAHALPKLLISNMLRAEVDQMKLLDVNQLKSQELERAMLILSFLGHAYVWGSHDIVNKIPKGLAIPWYEVAKKLNRFPVLSYASYALNNWQRMDETKPIRLGNIALLQNFFGGMDEEWFVLVHVDIEMKAAPAIHALEKLSTHVLNENPKLALENLQLIQNSLKDMVATLERMPEHCDPYIYYNRVRPYIHGWKDNPALPQGLLYEGVEDYRNQPQFFRGETGAQSSIIPSLDIAFGIQHQADPLRTYLQEMRDYMPATHRQFLEKLEHTLDIRSVVLKYHTEMPKLKDYYNECLTLISRFRQTHLHYAAHYIQKQSQTSAANPTEIGTGGTPFMIYLRKHKDETLKFLI